MSCFFVDFNFYHFAAVAANPPANVVHPQSACAKHVREDRDGDRLVEVRSLTVSRASGNSLLHPDLVLHQLDTATFLSANASVLLLHRAAIVESSA